MWIASKIIHLQGGDLGSSLIGKIPWIRDSTPSILAWKINMTVISRGRKELQTRLSNFHFNTYIHSNVAYKYRLMKSYDNAFVSCFFHLIVYLTTFSTITYVVLHHYFNSCLRFFCLIFFLMSPSID